MASEIMRQILETERACDERLEQARAAAAQTVSAAAKQGDALRQAAAERGKQRTDEILLAAQKKADDIAAAEKENSDAQVAALKESAAGRQPEAVKKTMVKLLELS